MGQKRNDQAALCEQCGVKLSRTIPLSLQYWIAETWLSNNRKTLCVTSARVCLTKCSRNFKNTSHVIHPELFASPIEPIGPPFIVFVVLDKQWRHVASDCSQCQTQCHKFTTLCLCYCTNLFHTTSSNNFSWFLNGSNTSFVQNINVSWFKSF